MLTRSKRLCEAVEKLEVEIADRQESVRTAQHLIDQLYSQISHNQKRLRMQKKKLKIAVVSLLRSQKILDIG